MRIDENPRTSNLLGLLLFGATIAVIFWNVLPPGMAFLAPDAMPFLPYAYRTVTLDNLLTTGAEATPHCLYWLFFHPLLANKLTYIVDSLLLALAAVYYLRSRGASLSAAWMAGVALAFSGYTFTLFSAGHRGYFHMFSCAVFAFGLLAKCFQERRLFHFAMLGCVLAWGLPSQADVLAMVVMLAGAYALWLTFAPACDPARRPWQRIRCVYPRFLLSIAVAAVIAWPGLKSVLGTQLGARKEQLPSSTAAPGATVSVGAEAKRAQWIFATNWSLPPEDMAEFIVPCLYGVDSFDNIHPYWGALGRPYDWQPGQRMMPNYRQHTVYLGAIQACFALLALLAWRVWRRRRDQAAPESADDGRLLADVPFWLGAGVCCLLLAMGRYLPFYHLFYAIPYMDLVRDPVKFLHLVEICVAFLFGAGVEVWLRAQRANGAVAGGSLPHAASGGGDAPAIGKGRRQERRNRLAKDAELRVRGAETALGAPRGQALRPAFDSALRVAAIVAAIAAGVILLAAGAIDASSDGVCAHIARVGLGAKMAESLSAYLVSNLLRAAFLFGVAALLLWLGRRLAGRVFARLLTVVLALAIAGDLAFVARRYVRPLNLAPFYAQNVVVQTALARGGVGVGVANYLTSNQSDRDWFSSALIRNGARLVTPAADDTNSIDFQTARALGRTPDNPFSKRPDIFWKTTQTRVVISTWQSLEPLVKAQVLTPVLTFAADPQSGALQTVQPAANAFLLAECAGRLPEAYVLDSWRGGLDVTNQLAALAQADWDPAQQAVTDAPAVAGGTRQAHMIGQARVISRRRHDFCFATRILTDAPQAGLLIVNEAYDAGNLEAHLDDRVVPLHRANALWCAVEVPAGSHTISIRHSWQPVWPLASALAGLAMGLWGLLRYSLSNGL